MGSSVFQEESYDERLDAYVEFLAGRLRKAHWHGRKEILGNYCRGLMLPGDRKSLEPMAARLDPLHCRAQHQALQHLVTDSNWDSEALIRASTDFALPFLRALGPIEAYPLDDVSFVKQGKHSVGVARQYCGAMGKTANCQVAVTVSISHGAGSLPCAFRLFLPQAWAEDPARRVETGIPPEIGFKKKWEIAIDLLDELRKAGYPEAPVLADAGYGDATAFREALQARNRSYAVQVNCTITVWPPGHGPVPPRKTPKGGRPTQTLRPNKSHPAVTVLDLAKSLPPEAWKTIEWREGTRGPMRGRFAITRVRIANKTEKRLTPPPEEWLLIEWPEQEPEPTKYWLSNVSPTMRPEDLVCLAKLRWRIERDYEELKGELGLDHFEGRTWRGFHHHASLCFAAYAFMVTERARVFPPSIRDIIRSQRFAIPEAVRRRGSPARPSPA